MFVSDLDGVKYNGPDSGIHRRFQNVLKNDRGASKTIYINGVTVSEICDYDYLVSVSRMIPILRVIITDNIRTPKMKLFPGVDVGADYSRRRQAKFEVFRELKASGQTFLYLNLKWKF